MSHTTNIVALVDRGNAEVIATLEGLLAEAKKGEIVALIGLADLPGGQYKMFGGVTKDRHRMAGILMDLAVNRLTED
jgi:hypothetical protein